MAGHRRLWRTIVLWVIVGLVVIFGAIQLVPYGRDHANPPATNAFIWADAKAEAIAQQSCYDCHSNKTDWWWATNIAPFSWLVTADVNGGRENMNFSEWQGGPDTAGFREALGGMPPFQYLIIHWSARLSDAEKQTLTDGYAASLAQNGAGQTPSSGSPVTEQATAIIDSQCTGCHSAQRALDYRAANITTAAALIDHMVQKGAKVDEAQKQTLIEYFTQ